MITATWKKGFEGFHKADAQRVADEIIEIGSSATPQQIVERAKDPNSELHRCFTWNDSIAAEKWRLEEARTIVQHLVIKDVSKNKETPEIRFFYRIDSSGYKQAEMIFCKEDDYKKLLQQAYAELQAFKRKYSSLSELDYILELID